MLNNCGVEDILSGAPINAENSMMNLTIESGGERTPGGRLKETPREKVILNNRHLHLKGETRVRSDRANSTRPAANDTNTSANFELEIISNRKLSTNMFIARHKKKIRRPLQASSVLDDSASIPPIKYHPIKHHPIKHPPIRQIL